MKTIFRDKKITGILCVLPEQEILFDDEAGNYGFPAAQTQRLKKVMGYNKHRVVKPGTASSDLCVFGARTLIERGDVNVDDVCAIVAVTLTPDHFVPHVGNIIQARCGFPQDVCCLDILQGCCGYLVGLAQAFMLLDYNPGKKVLLFNVDTLSKKISKRDRNSYPLTGDCAAVTVVENRAGAGDIYYNVRMDGARGAALMIPAGGSRLPCGPETALMTDDGSGNVRSLDNFVMDGTAVFQFVMSDVPPVINETLAIAGLADGDIDYYLFHQPNRFMLQKLAQRLGVPEHKVFMNVVENYGNPSGVSIPLSATANLGGRLMTERFTCCLSGFGSGLAYGAMVIKFGEMDFCENIVSDL